MRRSFTILFLLVAGLLLPRIHAAEPATTVDPQSPEAAVMLPVQALRQADFNVILDAMPAEEREKLEAKWQAQSEESVAEADAQEFNETWGKLTADDAVEQLMAEAQPNLAQMQPAQMAGMVGILPMMLQQQQQENPDQIDPEMQNWILNAGINDPEPLRQALTLLTDWAKNQEIATIEDLQGKSFAELVDFANGFTATAKKMITIYSIPVDSFLDSISATSSGSGDTRDLTVTFQVFGKERSLTTRVIKGANGFWHSKEIGPVEDILDSTDAVEDTIPEME